MGLPVSGSNSFREKPEETGPWTESGVASPFPGPYGKVSPLAVLEESDYLVWPFQGRSPFPTQAEYRSKPSLISHDSPRTQAPPPAPRPRPEVWGVWKVCDPLTRFYPSPAGRRGLGLGGWDQATFRLGWAPGTLSSAAGIGPSKRGAFASRKGRGRPSPPRQGRSQAEEREGLRGGRPGGLPGPLPTEVSCVSACLFSLFALFCKSVLMTLTFSPSGFSCDSDK